MNDFRIKKAFCWKKPSWVLLLSNRTCLEQRSANIVDSPSLSDSISDSQTTCLSRDPLEGWIGNLALSWTCQNSIPEWRPLSYSSCASESKNLKAFELRVELKQTLASSNSKNKNGPWEIALKKINVEKGARKRARGSRHIWLAKWVNDSCQ